MAKKEITGYVKLQIKGGQANPAPPVGPALGQRGINIMEFCKAFNEKTKSFIFSLAIASACFIVMLPAITLPGSLEPLFSLAASLIKCDAGGDLIIKSNFLSL